MRNDTLTHLARRRRTLALAGLTALPSLALAQAQPNAPAAAPNDAVEQIVITAERRGERIKDVPNSVSALKGELLETLAGSGADVRALAARTPSLNIESSFGRAFPRFYLRGLGNTDFDLNASQPVSLLLDDVVQENPLLKGFPMFDMRQVEVLRGPQGTLFGRNSPAGVVKFESERPALGSQAGYLSAGLGTWHAMNLEGAANLPLSDSAALRVSMLSQSRRDWVDNTRPDAPNARLEGYNDRAARVQLLLAPDRDFEALLNLHARELNGTARLFRANIIKPGSNDLVDDFDPYKVSMDGRNQQNVSTLGGSARLKWKLPGFTLHSVTALETVKAFSRADVDGGYGAAFAPPSGPGVIPFPVETADGLPHHRQFTQELRAQSDNPAGLNWIAGVFYFDERISIDSFAFDTLAGGVQTGYARQEQDNKAYAAFGSLIVPVTETLTLRGGLRYTRDRKDFSVARTQSPFGAPNISLQAQPSDNDLSWDLAGTWKAGADTNLFVRAARGFRAPSIQGRVLFGDTISVADSEHVTQFEAGVKADLLDRRLQMSFTLFQFRMDKPQLTASRGANFFELINADRAKGQGFELDLRARPADRLDIGGSLSLNATRIQDKLLSVPACGTCTPTDPVAPNGGRFVDGNPLPQAPRWVASLNLRQGWPLASGAELFAFTDWAYRGRATNALARSVEFDIKPLLEGGLRIGYIAPKGNFELAASVRNITNRVQVIGGVEFNNLTGLINEPRTFAVQMRSSF